MARKAMTEEQVIAHQEKRKRFAEMVKRVAAMDDVQRAHLTSRVGAVLTVEGRALSLHNTLLAIFQKPDVSLVGGFRQWLKQGRCVRKGQHGVSIWIPLGASKVGNGELTAEPSAAEAEGHSTRFGMGTVFDVTQTEAISTDSTQPQD